MIKVLANSVEQAREIAEAFRDSKTDVLIDIKEIKNITAENSDVTIGKHSIKECLNGKTKISLLQ